MNQLKFDRAVFKCSQDVRDRMKGSHCALAVSVGGENHEGGKLLATVQLINENCQRCSILLGDTLQRYTIALDTRDFGKNSYKEALKRGDDWIERNQEILAHFTIPYEIVRWDTWLKHPKYLEHKAFIEDLFHADAAYQEAVRSAAQMFIDRYLDRGSETPGGLDLHQVYDLCFEYIKEECNIIVPFWFKSKYRFIFYPGEMNAGLVKTHELLLQSIPQTKLAKWIRIKFKKRTTDPFIK